MSKVFIAFQANEESRPVVDAILGGQPAGRGGVPPGLVKIDCPTRLVIRATIEEEPAGRSTWQQIHVNP